MTTLLEDTLTYDEKSCVYWSEHLSSYGAKMRSRSDSYAVAAAVISAITGAAIWTTVSHSTEIWAQLIVTAMAVAAAIAALMPKLKGYSDCATNAPSLASKYGRHLTKLRRAHDDLNAGIPGAAERAWSAVNEFYDIRDEKEKLTPYPAQLEAEASKMYDSGCIMRIARDKVEAECLVP